MESETKTSFGPVTALIMRVVKPGRMHDFEQWVKDVNQVVKGFEGYLGTDLICPRDPAHPEYVVVLRFDEYEHLRAWMESPECNEWVQCSEDMTVGELHLQEAHRFAPWFTLPDRATPPASPAKYKMALLTILVLYPSLLALSTLLQNLLRGWPRPLQMLLTVFLLVPAMTYYLMPWMTRLFRSWLYPETTPAKSPGLPG